MAELNKEEHLSELFNDGVHSGGLHRLHIRNLVRSLTIRRQLLQTYSGNGLPDVNSVEHGANC